MCGPAALAPMMMPLMIATTAIGAVGAVAGGFMQAQAIEQQAEMQARQSQMNAAAERRDADLTRVAAQYESRMQAEKARRLLGEQRNQLAASGIMIDQGSALDLQVDSATEAAMDRAAIEWSADQKAGNLRYSASVGDWNAGEQRRAGKIASRNAVIGGFINGAGALASGGANILGSIY